MSFSLLRSKSMRAFRASLLLGFIGLSPLGAHDKFVDDFFDSTDPFIRDTVIPNIEKYRKSDATITLTDEAGKPVVGATIAVRQFEQNFLWGCVPPNEDPIWGTSDVFKLWRAIYNFGIPEIAYKWDSVEKVRGALDFSRGDKLLETINSSGAKIELHFLAGYTPSWLYALTEDEQAKVQQAHILAMLEHYHDKIRYYQVYNEVAFRGQKRGNASVYFDMTPFFAEIAKKYPDLHLGINDGWPWDLVARGGALPSPDVLKKTYPGIGFIGMHGHKPGNYYISPQEFYKFFNPYIGSGVKAQLTEFGVTAEPIIGNPAWVWTDELRAKYFVSVYATAFSHPALEAFNQWGIGPQVNRWTENQIIDNEGVPKPSYYAIKSLLKDRFMTKAEGKTDAGGLYAYRGFRGRYEVTVEQGGQRTTAEITLGDADGSFALKLVTSPEGLRLEGGNRVSHFALNPSTDTDAKDSGTNLVVAAGVPVVFDGLEAVNHFEILGIHEQPVRIWELIGDRIEWDGTDSDGELLQHGTYVIRATSRNGKTVVRHLIVR